VEDNGAWKEADDAGNHYGLSNMERRCRKKTGYSLHKKNTGTRMTLMVPVHRLNEFKMKKRITIIEDNWEISQGFAALIGTTDAYQLIGQYGSCEDALKMIAVDQPDLILMDIDLPGINGIEGTLRVKKQLPDCIVLIITVLEDSSKVFQSLCAGAGGYIVKSSDGDNIVRNIEEAFSGGAPMSLQIAKMVVKSFNRSLNSPLSEREHEVLKRISEGKSYSKIALDLFISKETVRSHIKNIYQKLAVNSKDAALKVAGNNKWLF
jgi:DNA-binding NarL/FixJ family response regulator